MMKRAAVCIFVLAFAACSDTKPAGSGGSGGAGGSAGSGGSGGQGVNPTAGLGATESDAIAAQSVATPTFNVFQLQDLWTAYSIESIPSVAVLRIQMKQPDGSLNTTYTAAYSLNPGAQPTIMPPGLGVPIDVRPVTMVNGRIMMTFPIPVSGTDYVRHPYAGTWTAHFSLDNVAGSAVDSPFNFRTGP
jgi:hypothetical protein